ncbi:MAG: response regulator [Pseudomonadota bacterium]|nr:response regulator [Pseudomonadota bacterium]
MPNSIAVVGRILLLDDQPASIRLVTTLLKHQGHEVITVGSAAAALAVCRERRPDLILIDTPKSEGNSLALLRDLKSDPQLARIPAVFLTASHDRELLLQAFDAGAVDYVTKPFFPEELIARVKAHLVFKLTRDRLERVAEERQNLVNLVAHDLKNPLTSVLFATDMLKLGDITAERNERYLQIIHEATMDAISYIRAYLESQSNPQAPKPEGQEKPVASMHDVVSWLVDRYSLQLQNNGIEIKTALPERAGNVYFNPMVLRQVAENLVSNVGKYAKSGGELELGVRNGAPGFLQLVVQDRGPGIPLIKQRELFKPFTRLSDIEPADNLSSGLGLSLARQIVMNAGGHLYYEDREGGGARFVIELPHTDASSTVSQASVVALT